MDLRWNSHKVVEFPVITHQAIADAPLVPLFGGLLLLFRGEFVHFALPLARSLLVPGEWRACFSY